MQTTLTEQEIDKSHMNLLPAAFFSSVMQASSSWTRLMFWSLSSATKDTCTDRESDTDHYFAKRKKKKERERETESIPFSLF